MLPHLGHFCRLVLAAQPHDVHLQFITDPSLWRFLDLISVCVRLVVRAVNAHLACASSTEKLRCGVPRVHCWLRGFHVCINVGHYPRPQFNSRCLVSRGHHTMQVEDKQLVGPQVKRPIVSSGGSPSSAVFPVSPTARARGIAV